MKGPKKEYLMDTRKRVLVRNATGEPGGGRDREGRLEQPL